MTANIPEVWVDKPFALLQTPMYKANIKLNKDTDEYVEVASKMCIIHNFLIRGLNSIYLQAPHVEPKDFGDFIAYSQIWCEATHSHHEGEEESFFPLIENAAEKKDLMAGNVAEHQIFQPGLQAMKSYLDSLKGHEESFSGSQLCTLIDAFASTLSNHLAAEISTLLDLASFGSKIPIRDLWEKEGERHMSGLGKTTEIPFAFLNWDLTYEDGMWSGWPPIPAFVRWSFCNILTLRHAGYWKFASCDGFGRPKPLYALPTKK